MTGRRLLLLTGALLAGVWLVVPPTGVPLYDGVGFPDEQYRYIQPPTSAPKTKPATTAQLTVPVSGGRSGQVNAISKEQGPQVVVFIPAGGLSVPAGAPSVTVTAVPRAPTVLPTDGTLDGNVYQVTASAPRGPAKLAGGSSNQSQILLRLPQGAKPPPTLEIFANGRWRTLSTGRYGQDIYGGYLPSLGDFALVTLFKQPTANGPVGSGGGASGGLSMTRILLMALGATIVVLSLLIGGIRLRRLRRPEQPVP